MALSSGSRLGPYEILSPLGAGGMGEVYRARDTRLGRDVAVKVLPASFSSDPDRLRRFEQEAKAAGILNHPNITAVYDIGDVDGAPYVVSELLEGETLRSILAGGHLSPRKAIDHSLQIAHGLAAAHEKGIVHRDLKPENIFVTTDERVKILDFGLAKLTSPEISAGPLTEAPTAAAGTEPGIVLGTIGYMSPEQVRGKPADSRSDIFSFGAILYEMLSGKRAFRGESAADTISAILREDPADLSVTNPRISPALGSIVRHCLEKSREARFQSARDAAFALQEASERAAVRRTPSTLRLRFRLAVAGAVVLAALVIVFAADSSKIRTLFRAGAFHPRIQSLAVLPLQNFSHDPEQDYFADGMTEALIASVSQISSLRVISRTSVMQYKGAKKPLPDIARALNVDAVVEGSVLRSGEMVRITATLIDAKSDQHLWAKTYERELRDVLTLQGEVAQAIATQIRTSVSSAERARLTASRPIDPEAHDSYLRGRFYWNKRDEEGLRRALDYFSRALEKDPNYALAYTGLADCYLAMGDRGLLPSAEAFPRAKQAARNALALDDLLAEAHVSLASAKKDCDWDWRGAEAEYRRAIELNSNYATAHHWYGLFLAQTGRFTEALEEIQRAHDLDPLSMAISGNIGLFYYFARRYDEAIRECRKVLELAPHREVHSYIGRAYLQKGMYHEALAEFQAYAADSHDSVEALAALGYAFAVSGNTESALDKLRQLETLSRNRHVPPYLMALVHSGLGGKDDAFACLERGFRERCSYLIYLKIDPRLDALRSDPRFAALIRRIGFPS